MEEPAGARQDDLAGLRFRDRDEIVRYYTSPEVQKQITAMGAVLDLKGTEEMRKIIPAEIAKWTKVAIETGMPRETK